MANFMLHIVYQKFCKHPMCVCVYLYYGKLKRMHSVLSRMGIKSGHRMGGIFYFIYLYVV